jgi:NitT/TauT family transport system substrate-binding protein
VRRPLLAAVLVAAALLVGCKHADGTKTTLALNWKPEPEFGGIYEALDDGAFARHGLELAITGGPGAPVVQMVDAGTAVFGIASADEVVIARARGTDIVAVFATYQTNPQGIMVHASRGFASLGKAMSAGGTLAVEPGLPYVKFLQSRYDMSAMHIVPYTFSIAPFLSDPMMMQQVFITSEPIAAKREGSDPKVFLVADSGYDPYAAVVITTGKVVRDQPELVASMVDALREGWRRYLEDPSRANATMGKLNTEMDAATFRLAAAAQKPLIEVAAAGDADVGVGAGTKVALGSMTVERWRQLIGQLHDLEIIDVEPAAIDCFAETP